MHLVGDKVLYYDGSIITFKKLICTSKGCIYYFHELNFGIKQEDLEMLILSYKKVNKKRLPRQVAFC
jgi:hypothetical protein